MFLVFETPSPAADLTSAWVVSPGIEGFIAMVRHVRKANFRAAEREEELWGPLPEEASGKPAERGSPTAE